jgi:hypothetical protein
MPVKSLVASVVVVLSLSPTAALADMTKDECIEANAKGQDLRHDGKLSAAREQLRACATSSCPALVRYDCTRRLDELDQIQPTIVFVAKDASGRDVTGVTVTVDGRPLTDKLDGTELPVDPGEHVFTFTAPAQPPVSKTLVLAVGEKDRREVVVVGGKSPAALPGGRAGGPELAPPVPMAHLAVAADDGATIAVDGQVVARGRFDARKAAGPHEVSVTEAGMKPYQAEIDLREGETRTLQITLEAERHGGVWPWIVGGAVLAAGAAVGGYLLFKPSPATPAAMPPDQLGSLQLAASAR